jgi:hypothetical protein
MLSYFQLLLPFFSFSYYPSQLRGWMDDETNLGEVFFLAIVRPIY